MSAQKNAVEMLLHWAKERPNQPWLFQPIDGVWHTTTWAQAEAQVRSMATALRKLGLAEGDRVAISGRNTAHWFLADLACGLAGLVSVGLYPKQAPEAVTYILKHSGTKAVFLGPMPDIDEFVGAMPKGLITIGFPYPGTPAAEHAWDDLVKAHEPFTGYVPPSPDALSTLVYTSGTTGNPKGVMLTHGNALFAADGLMKALPSQGNERFFSYLPLAHAFERGAVEMSSLYFGAEVHFLENLDKLAEQLPAVGPTRFFGVPLVYSRMQAGILKKMPQEKLDRLLKLPIISSLVKKKIKKGLGLHNARYCIVGAAAMPIPLMQWFEKLGVTILQGYGMTENSIYATVNRPGANRLGSVGKEMPGANLKIAEDGEILFQHPGVMKGYYLEEEKTRETFTGDGYLRTGDRGYVDKDGYLFITGRVKDIFKTLKGKYVAPAPIEGALMRNPDIDQLCFVGSGLKQPIMLVSLNAAGRAKSKAQVEKELAADMDAVNATLEPHEEIAKIVLVKDTWTIDNGIMTPTMKVKRNEVERRYLPLIEKEAGVRSKIGWEA
ncbi:MAG TPA: AMP-binding protein [Nevskiaceae bacterium]|nr:AMP-binding protein [Nevskiaceae bacterium]